MQKIPLNTNADISSQGEGLKSQHNWFSGRKISYHLHKDLAKKFPENSLMLNARQFLVNEIFSLMIILSALS